MALNENLETKSKLVLASSIWMGLIGFAIILFDGVYLSIANPTRDFQEVIFIMVLGLFALVSAYLNWKESRWTILPSILVSAGAVFLINGYHSMIYSLSPTITAAMVSFYIKFEKDIQ